MIARCNEPNLGLPHATAAHVMIGVGLLIVYLTPLELWLAHSRDYYGYPPVGVRGK